MSALAPQRRALLLVFPPAAPHTFVFLAHKVVRVGGGGVRLTMAPLCSRPRPPTTLFGSRARIRSLTHCVDVLLRCSYLLATDGAQAHVQVFAPTACGSPSLSGGRGAREGFELAIVLHVDHDLGSRDGRAQEMYVSQRVRSVLF